MPPRKVPPYISQALSGSALLSPNLTWQSWLLKGGNHPWMSSKGPSWSSLLTTDIMAKLCISWLWTGNLQQSEDSIWNLSDHSSLESLPARTKRLRSEDDTLKPTELKHSQSALCCCWSSKTLIHKWLRIGSLTPLGSVGRWGSHQGLRDSQGFWQRWEWLPSTTQAHPVFEEAGRPTQLRILAGNSLSSWVALLFLLLPLVVEPFTQPGLGCSPLLPVPFESQMTETSVASGLMRVGESQVLHFQPTVSFTSGQLHTVPEARVPSDLRLRDCEGIGWRFGAQLRCKIRVLVKCSGLEHSKVEFFFSPSQTLKQLQRREVRGPFRVIPNKQI